MGSRRAGWRRQGSADNLRRQLAARGFPHPKSSREHLRVAVTNDELPMLARYLAVEEGRSIGLTWRDAWVFAVDWLSTTPASGSWSTMKRSHRLGRKRWGDTDSIDSSRVHPAFDVVFSPSPERQAAVIETALSHIQELSGRRFKHDRSKREAIVKAARDRMGPAFAPLDFAAILRRRHRRTARPH